jgi:hypothetical protein
MYEDIENVHSLQVSVCYSPESVTILIEKLINNCGYCLADFSVIHGTKLSLKAVHTSTKVLLTN